MNPYEVLGLKPGPVSKSAIEAAHRNLRGSAHPDRNQGSEEKMSQLNQARDILTSPERKRRFDELGSTESGQLTIEEQATLILGNLFDIALEKASQGTSHSKLCALVAVEVAKGRQKALSAQLNHPAKLKRARGLLKAVKCDPLLRKILEMRLARIEHEITEINQQVQLGALMLNLMKSVEFTP